MQKNTLLNAKVIIVALIDLHVEAKVFGFQRMLPPPISPLLVR